jgi:hypothetical protein
MIDDDSTRPPSLNYASPEHRSDKPSRMTETVSILLKSFGALLCGLSIAVLMAGDSLSSTIGFLIVGVAMCFIGWLLNRPPADPVQRRRPLLGEATCVLLMLGSTGLLAMGVSYLRRWHFTRDWTVGRTDSDLTTGIFACSIGLAVFVTAFVLLCRALRWKPDGLHHP